MRTCTSCNRELPDLVIAAKGRCVVCIASGKLKRPISREKAEQESYVLSQRMKNRRCENCHRKCRDLRAMALRNPERSKVKNWKSLTGEELKKELKQCKVYCLNCDLILYPEAPRYKEWAPKVDERIWPGRGPIEPIISGEN